MDKKLKELDKKIEALQKEKAILILEKEIEAVKNSTVVPRIIYQDVYVPRVVQYPQWVPAITYPQTPMWYGSVNCQAGPPTLNLNAGLTMAIASDGQTYVAQTQ